MKKVLFTLLALFSINAYADADWLSPAGMTKVMEGVDDGTFHVSLGHTFPYYGGIFTDAWMSSNGVIILYDPTTQFGNWNTRNSMCCSGYDLTNWEPWQGDQFSFMLAPLWTDLRDANLTTTDGYYYKTNEGVSSFLWYDVVEFGTSNTNTFQANLWPDGSFDFLYDEVDITQHNTFMGFTGDITKNEINQLGYYQGGVTEFDIDFHSQSVNGGRAWYGSDGGYETKLDCSNALNDSGCPGYEEAFFEQECLYDPLYDQQCSGYQGALAAQDLTGTDFIFGDDISDFYYEEETEMFLFEEDETYMFTEEESYGFQSDEFDTTGTFEEEDFIGEPETIYSEEFGEVYTEPTLQEERAFPDEPILPEEEGMGTDPIGEDLALEDEYFESEFTQVDEDMSNLSQDLHMTEDTISQPSVNAVSIALTTVANAESAARQTAYQQSVDSGDYTQDFTFGDFDAAFENATINMLVDPTVTVTEISEEEVVEFQMEATTTQMDTGFAAQQDQSFSTGQSITAVLNNVQPNFSQFDVAPPSQTEQQTTAKAESQANNMSEEQLAANLDEFADDMKNSGGFGDQSLTVFLMGRNAAFAQYNNVNLQDNPFYDDRGLPTSRVQNDRNTMLQLIGTSGKHEELISGQYK
jgi:hypothetical protein